MIERFGKNEIDAVVKSINKSSLLSGYTNKFLGGETLQKFEKEFAKFHNCKYGISVNALSRGLASLLQRGLLYKDNQSYFIHYRLIAYMRLKADVDYGTALHEIKIR